MTVNRFIIKVSFCCKGNENHGKQRIWSNHYLTISGLSKWRLLYIMMETYSKGWWPISWGSFSGTGGPNPSGYRRAKSLLRYRGLDSYWYRGFKSLLVPKVRIFPASRVQIPLVGTGVRFLQVPRVRFLQTGLRYLFIATVIVKSLILFLVLNLHYFYLAKIISAISLAIFCNHSFIR